MTPEHLAQFQRDLDLRLPASYAAFLLNFPAELHTTRGDVGDAYSVPSTFQLQEDVRWLVWINRDVRDDPGTSWVKGGGAWPHEHVIIGEDGGGDFSTVRLGENDPRVWTYEHEDGEFVPLAADVHAFARDLGSAYRAEYDAALHKQRMAHERLARKLAERRKRQE